MKIIGLRKLGKKVVKNSDIAVSYSTHSVGDGLWTIEVEDKHGACIKEFVGENGTRYPKTDLYAEMRKWWDNGIFCTYVEYEAPDGSKGSYSHFKREIDRGRLHGLVVSV